jgi:hypothetical protein
VLGCLLVRRNHWRDIPSRHFELQRPAMPENPSNPRL